MKTKLLTLLLLPYLLTAIAQAAAEAPRIKISATLVRGNNALSRKETKITLNEVRQIFRTQVGLDLQLVNLRQIRAPKAFLYLTLEKALTNQAVYYWSKRFGRLKYSQNGVIDIAIMPTIPHTDNRDYFAGVSGGLCSLASGFVVNYAGTMRTNGESGLNLAKHLIAHEMGHILGATHIETQSIMHPTALQYAEGTNQIPFDIESVNQIRECLKDWGRIQ